MLHRTIYIISNVAMQGNTMKTIKTILKKIFPSTEETYQRRFEKFMEGAEDICEIEYRHYLWDRGYGYKKDTFGGLQIR